MRSCPFLSIAGLLLTLVGQAQSFQYRADVNRVQKSGFYRIVLPPTVLGRLNADLTDIRLYDGKQQEIPYRLVRETPGRLVAFTDYEIVRRLSKPGVSTTLVMRNRAKSQINSLVMISKNTNAARKAKLSGSTDAQNWYAIDDDLWLEPTQATAKTTDTRTINFPLSDYEYYRLDINDSLRAPLNILRVGCYASKTAAGIYTSVPNLLIAQRDSSDRNTYVHLTQPDGARLDRLTIFVNATTPYRRRATISQLHTRKRKRGRLETWFEPIRALELSSPDSTVADLPGLKANSLYLIIANDDNKPLSISRVHAYQLTTHLVANLTANINYQLRFSDGNTAAPSYDLTSLKSVDTHRLPTLGIGSLMPASTGNKPMASLFFEEWIIWPALGLVLFLVGFLSYRLLKEMGNTGE